MLQVEIMELLLKILELIFKLSFNAFLLLIAYKILLFQAEMVEENKEINSVYKSENYNPPGQKNRSKDADEITKKFIQEKYKMIENSEDVYCEHCGTFLPVKCYTSYLYMGRLIHCIACGGNITTASNINKIHNNNGGND